jgi:hypothetical protein
MISTATGTQRYYLGDGIYPPWSTFMKTTSTLKNEKQASYVREQEGCRKDVEWVFGVLQAH